MNNFHYRIPTEIYFGKNQIENLKNITAFGKTVLLVYGGQSIKKMGLYNKVKSILEDCRMNVFELGGIEPNPKIESVRKGVDICKKEKVDVVLPVGGGSVLDCAKVIAAGAKYEGDPWDLVLDGSKIAGALPVVTVLTLSATGSEMDEFAVISDMDKNEKWGTGSEYIKPAFSILDPTYTFTVSKKQTAAGTADIMSHIFENYFTNAEGAFVQARFCESLLKTCIKYGPVALNEPDNYEARANLMWTSSLAINGLLSLGAEVTWCVHPMEHELSAFYDITHGEGLAVLTPVWMEYVLSDKTDEKFAQYGENVFDLPKGKNPMETAKEAISKTREFFAVMGLPATLGQLGIDETHFDKMAEKAAEGLETAFVPLTKDDVKQIFKNAL